MLLAREAMYLAYACDLRSTESAASLGRRESPWWPDFEKIASRSRDRMVVFSLAVRVPAAGDPSALAWGSWMVEHGSWGAVEKEA